MAAVRGVLARDAFVQLLPAVGARHHDDADVEPMGGVLAGQGWDVLRERPKIGKLHRVGLLVKALWASI